MNGTDITHMRHALSLGARGLGKTWPNPSVGCVIVVGEHIVGRGRTADGGIPHAETEALDQAGDAARGATAYVTLEPCSHHGRTPPCVDALIAAGIERVVIAAKDPNAQVDGQGIARLNAAGVEVEIGVLEQQALDQHVGFIYKTTRSRPMVTLKLAASLDGRIAASSGESNWITGVAARRAVHAQRSQHDAVMVGAGTVRSDDPSLTVRDLGVNQQPVRIVWSQNLDIPLDGQLARTAKETPVWVVHGENADQNLCAAWQGLGAKLLPCRIGPDRRLDPKAALEHLGAAGLTRIYCEGGGTLAASLMRADLVDELVCFNAGIAIGADGFPMVSDLGLGALADAKRFDLLNSHQFGHDIMTHWRRAKPIG